MVETTAILDKSFVSRREAKIAKEEEEIKQMEAELYGKPKEEEKGKPQENEPLDEITNEGNNEEDKTLTAEEKTFKKRYGDLRRHMQEERDRWQKEKAALEAGPVAMPATEEEVEAWITQYPQVAAIVKSLAIKEAEDRSTAKFKETEELAKSLQKEKYELQQQKAEQAIMKEHPDFMEIREDNAFHEWASAQSKVVQEALYENSDDAMSVISVLDLYKAKMGITKKAKDTSDAEAAMAVGVKGASTPNDKSGQAKWSDSKVDALSDREFAKHEAEIDKAIAEGKYIYDMSN